MISAVAYVSDHLSGKKEPVPITSIGALTLDISLHFCGPNSLDATICTLFQPLLFKDNRKCQIAAALTPVPTSHLSSSSVLKVFIASGAFLSSYSYELAVSNPSTNLPP